MIDVTFINTLKHDISHVVEDAEREKELTMSTPKVQPLLLPVLKTMGDGAEHLVEDIRKRVAEELRLTDDELKETHRRSGQSVYVNLIAFALAHFNVGKAIAKKRNGVYQIAERGRTILARGASDLTINDARNA